MHFQRSPNILNGISCRGAVTKAVSCSGAVAVAPKIETFRLGDVVPTAHVSSDIEVVECAIHGLASFEILWAFGSFNGEQAGE